MFTEMFTGRSREEWDELHHQLVSMATAIRELDTSLQDLRRGFDQIANARTPAALGARLDDLEQAFESHRASLRRELGRLWGHSGAGRGAPADDTGDDDLAALLSLQAAKPPGPNGS